MINVNVKNYTNWVISSQDSKQKCKNKVQRLSKWSKLKAELKSRDMVISPRKFENIILGKSTI